MLLKRIFKDATIPCLEASDSFTSQNVTVKNGLI